MPPPGARRWMLPGKSGIDVPNATLMIIEHAERFGLSQLHQLRGRVGRGQHASQCLLIAYPSLSEDGKARLEAIQKSNDGFVIAEEDLKIRVRGWRRLFSIRNGPGHAECEGRADRDGSFV